MSRNEWERVLERSIMKFALFDSMVSITFTAMVMPGGCLRLNGYIWIAFQHQGFKKLMGHKMSPTQSW